MGNFFYSKQINYGLKVSALESSDRRYDATLSSHANCLGCNNVRTRATRYYLNWKNIDNLVIGKSEYLHHYLIQLVEADGANEHKPANSSAIVEGLEKRLTAIATYVHAPAGVDEGNQRKALQVIAYMTPMIYKEFNL